MNLEAGVNYRLLTGDGGTDLFWPTKCCRFLFVVCAFLHSPVATHKLIQDPRAYMRACGSTSGIPITGIIAFGVYIGVGSGCRVFRV